MSHHFEYALHIGHVLVSLSRCDRTILFARVMPSFARSDHRLEDLRTFSQHADHFGPRVDTLLTQLTCEVCLPERRDLMMASCFDCALTLFLMVCWLYVC